MAGRKETKHMQAIRLPESQPGLQAPGSIEWNLSTDEMRLDGVSWQSADECLAGIRFEDVDRVRSLVASVRAGDLARLTERVQVRSEEGDVRWIRVDAVVAEEDGGRVLVGAYCDVTSEMGLISELRDEREALRNILERLPDGIILTGSDGVHRFATSPTGYVPYRAAEEIVGRRLSDLLPERAASLLSRGIERAQESGRVETVRYVIEVEGESKVREARIVPATEGRSVLVTRDITEAVRIEEALLRRDAVLSVVAVAADRFLRGPADEQMIDEMIAQIGRSIDVGRVFIFENRIGPDQSVFTKIRFEWCSEGIEPILHHPMLQGTALDELGVGSWVGLFQSGRVITGNVSDFTEQERVVLDQFGVRSIAMAPIFVGDRWWGIIGFADYARKRDWARPEADALRTAATVLGAALEQQEAEEALRHSEERWRRLVDNHPGPILVCIRQRIAYLNQSAVEVLGATSAASVMGRDLGALVPTMAGSLCESGIGSTDVAGPGKRAEHRFRGFDGRERVVEAVSVPITHEGQPAVQTVLQDVTERKRHEADLIDAKERAEDMNRLKTSFLANMSHEIRTPLTSVIGYADVLMDLTTGKASDFVSLIRAGANRLMDTLTSVLDLAQLEGRSRELRTEFLDVREQVRDVCLLYGRRFEQKGLNLEMRVPEDRAVEAHLDRRAFGRILINLLDNALKFTDDGEVVVEVVSADDSGGVILRVKDSGIGIGDAFIPHVFDQFKQESDGLSRRYGGSGLGLSITRRLVELMDGSVEVESRAGEGSTFTVVFPSGRGVPGTG